MANAYNQDKHTMATINAIKKMLDAGQVDNAVAYLKNEIKTCKENTSAEASKAFAQDVVMHISLFS